MALKYSTAIRNAKLDVIETTVGASAILKIISGTIPASVGATDPGTVLATLNLPADWMAAAASGSKALLGTWQDSSADATGTAGHFTIFASDGTTPHIHGTITATGGGGDIELSSTSITATGSITITSFTINDNNG